MERSVKKGFVRKTAEGAMLAAAVSSTSLEANAESGIENINEGSEEFAIEVGAEKAFVEMEDGVLFFNAEGEPIAIVPASIIDGVNPGKGFSETRHVTEGYAVAWKNVARQRVEEITGEKVAGARYNWRDIQSALKNKNEAMDLHAIHSIIDIVYYFGDKEVRGGDGLSRIEYLRKHLQFDDSIPEEIQKELGFLALGIAGEESRYRSDLKSKSGAEGVFQFMPATVAGLGYEEYVVYKDDKAVDIKPIPYTVQVEMLGKHLSNIYKELYGHLSPEQIDSLRVLFESEEDFNTFFITPVMINAYNTGSGRMAKAIKEFITPERISQLQEEYDDIVRYDIFDDLTEFAKDSDDGLLAGYKDASASYTFKVYGYAMSISEGYDEYKQKQETYIVAAK